MKRTTIMGRSYLTVFVVFFCICVHQVHLECSFDEHKFKNMITHEIMCSKCKLCPPGMTPSQPCGSTDVLPHGTSVECVPCKNGHFSDKHDFSPCKQCSPQCGYEENETSNCTTKKNRICSCKDGLYRNLVTGKCTQECCYCVEGKSFEKDCLMRTDGKRCGNSNPDGKCRLTSTPQVPTKTPTNKTSNSNISTTKTNDQSTTDSDNELRDNHDSGGKFNAVGLGLGLGSGVVLIALILLGIYFYRRNDCKFTNSDENKNTVQYKRTTSSEMPRIKDTTALRKRHFSSGGSQSDEDSLTSKITLLPTIEGHVEPPKPAPFPTLDQILHTADQSCLNCDQIFGDDKVFEISGHWLNIYAVFDNITPDQHQKELRTLANLFELPFKYPKDMNHFMELMNSKRINIELKSFVKALRCIGREDVVKAIHDKCHEKSDP